MILLIILLLISMEATAQNSDFSKLAQQRQSVRSYENKPVEKEKIIKCLETTRISPSANNAQPWKFIVVDSLGLKNEVADAVSSMGMNKFAKQAPVIIVVVLEKRDLMSKIAGSMQDKDYSYLDIGIAVNQFCLQATEIGLSTCIVGWFNEKKIKNLLDIPKNKRVPLVITLGYSNVETRKKVRKSLEEISTFNKY